MALMASIPPRSNQCQFDGAAAKESGKAVANAAVRLYREISKKQENVIFSPVSIALALALLQNGAAGTTKSEIQSLIASPGSNATDSVASYESLQHHLQIQTDQARLSIANGLFYSEKLHLKSDYVEEMRACFETDISQQPFQSNAEQARVNINRWVSNATNDKIPELLKPGIIDGSVLAVLANAVYMKAPWLDRFYNTEDLQFYRGGKSDQAQMTKFMTKHKELGYISTSTVHAVELPYEHVPLSMFIILPKQRDGIQALEQSLTGEQLISLVTPQTSHDVILKLPIFTMRQSTDLMAVLSQLGLTQMFTDNADFSRMAVEPLKVSKALHEAYINVNVNGTEAAAATAFLMAAGSAFHRPPPDPPIEFIADHPFLYAIVHRPTSTITFLGKVSQVQQE